MIIYQKTQHMFNRHQWASMPGTCCRDWLGNADQSKYRQPVVRGSSCRWLHQAFGTSASILMGAAAPYGKQVPRTAWLLGSQFGKKINKEEKKERK